MSIARTVADVLSDHTTLELECIETPAGVAHYLRNVCGYQMPSSALLAPRTRDFVAAIKRYVKRARIDLIQFQRGERVDDRAQDYLQQPHVAPDSGQRCAALRFGCARVQALLCALLASGYCRGDSTIASCAPGSPRCSASRRRTGLRAV